MEETIRVLIACEYSGTVRDAFLSLGHDALSCDLLPTDSPGPHYQGNVEDLLGEWWDLMIAHPPCTDLAVSGARHFAAKIADGRQERVLEFVRVLLKPRKNIKRVVVENPISIISSRIRKPNQIIHPHQFGHPEFKATCLWEEGVPLLVPTNKLIVPKKGTDEWKSWNKVHLMPPGPDRWKMRSTTYSGIAKAMAEQWGSLA